MRAVCVDCIRAPVIASVVADVDGDGLPDAMFSLPQPFVVSSRFGVLSLGSAIGIAAGDLDGDGLPEALVLTGSAVLRARISGPDAIVFEHLLDVSAEAMVAGAFGSPNNTLTDLAFLQGARGSVDTRVFIARRPF
jgi:hypothetical protein